MKKSAALFAGIMLFNCFHVVTLRADDDINLRVLFTSDLGNQLQSFQIVHEDGTTEYVGGFGRLKTLIAQESTDHTIVLDAGNFTEGTFFDTLNDSASPALSLMSEIGYDAVGLGAKEADNSALMMYLDRVSELPVILNTNLSWEDERIVGHSVFVTDALNAGVFSVYVTDETEQDAYEKVSAALDQIQADVVIGLVQDDTSDGLFSENLAQNHDAITLLIDSTEADSKTVNQTTIVTAGLRGQYVGEVDISAASHKITDYKLISAENSVVVDEGINGKVSEYVNELTKSVFSPYGYQAESIIAVNPYVLTTANGEFKDNQTAQIVTDAYSYAYGNWYETWYQEWYRDRRARLNAAKEAAGDNADTDETVISIKKEEPPVKAVAIGLEMETNIKEDFPQGNLRPKDAYNAVTTRDGLDGLGLVFMYGSDLKQLAEFDVSYARNGKTDYQFFFSHMNYLFSEYRNEYNLVEEVGYNQVQHYYVPVKNDELYPVVTGLDVLNVIGQISRLTEGKLAVTMYDETGNVLSNLGQYTLKTDKNRVLKKYIGICNYLSDFELSGNTPTVTESYNKIQVNKKEDTKFNLIRFFKNTSHETLLSYRNGVIFVLLILIGYRIIRTIINKIYEK